MIDILGYLFAGILVLAMLAGIFFIPYYMFKKNTPFFNRSALLEAEIELEATKCKILKHHTVIEDYSAYIAASTDRVARLEAYIAQNSPKEAKKPARKPAAVTKPAAKKPTAVTKPAAKKPTRKPAAKKPTRKPAAKKPVVVPEPREIQRKPFFIQH